MQGTEHVTPSEDLAMLGNRSCELQDSPIPDADASGHEATIVLSSLEASPAASGSSTFLDSNDHALSPQQQAEQALQQKVDIIQSLLVKAKLLPALRAIEVASSSHDTRNSAGKYPDGELARLYEVVQAALENTEQENGTHTMSQHHVAQESKNASASIQDGPARAMKAKHQCFSQADTCDPDVVADASCIANDLIIQAACLFKEGKFDSALQTADRADKLQPNDYATLQLRGHIKGKLHDFRGVIQDLKGRADDEPSLVIRGTAYVYVGNADQAVADFVAADVLLPGTIDSICELLEPITGAGSTEDLIAITCNTVEAALRARLTDSAKVCIFCVQADIISC